MQKSMPRIINCRMDDCAYNKNDQCHAMAITVGDEVCAMCDTFMKRSEKGGISDMTGFVGACKVYNCRHNESLECTATGIHVIQHQDHGECNTFEAR